MMAQTQKRSGRTALFVVIAALLLLPLACSIVSAFFVQAAERPGEFLAKPDPKHDKCIEDTAYMRYHHWEYLRRVREEVVRYGDRSKPGLASCSECHTPRAGFCDRCHNAVSLYPDCFDCHDYK